MTEFVALESLRNRGWPDQNRYLNRMYGEDGWCPACGVPRHAQTGQLLLRRSGLTPSGAWMPYWVYDTICLDAGLAERVARQFEVDLRPVAWQRSAPGDAFQLVIPTLADSWFDSQELAERVMARHAKHYDKPGAMCPECGVWRWLPLPTESLPPLRILPRVGEVPIAASPEWFGDGWNAFRQVLVRRDLAEMIVKESPRDFAMVEVTWHTA